MPPYGKSMAIDYDRLDEILSSNARPSRSTPTHDLVGVTISAGGSQDIVKSDLDGYSALVVTVRATYDAAATTGVRVRWLYSPDGTNYDTVEDAEAQGNYEDLSFAAGETRQRTAIVPIFAPYVKIQVVNLDTSAPVTVDAWTTLMR